MQAHHSASLASDSSLASSERYRRRDTSLGGADPFGLRALAPRNLSTSRRRLPLPRGEARSGRQFEVGTGLLGPRHAGMEVEAAVFDFAFLKTSF